MTEPVTLTSATPRHALPLLFAAQAQKEAFINEALIRIDMLLQPAFLAERADPPEDPAPGDTYLVAGSAGGAWQGDPGSLACWSGSQWIFAAPPIGMVARDLSTGQVLIYDGNWQRISSPQPPTGGTVVDAECRAALTAVVAALKDHGIFSS